MGRALRLESDASLPPSLFLHSAAIPSQEAERPFLKLMMKSGL